MPDRDRVRLFVVSLGWAIGAVTTWEELADHGGFQAQALCKAGMALVVLAGWPLTRPDGPFGAAGERWAWVGRAVLADLALGIVVFFVAGPSWWSAFLVLGLVGSAAWMGAIAKATRGAARWWWPALAGAGFGAYLFSPAFLGGADPVLVLIAPTVAYAGWAAFPGPAAATPAWTWHYPRITVRNVLSAAIMIVLPVALGVASPAIKNALFPVHGLSPEVAHLPLSAPSACTLDRTTPTVYLLPLSPAGADLSLSGVATDIEARLGWRIRLLPPLELTRSDADVSRDQVTVQDVWKSMTTRCRLGPGHARIGLIGVTTLDMWSTDYQWDFLYSQRFASPLRGAVISTIRMSPGVTPGGTIAERLEKTIVRDVAIQYLGMHEGSDPMLKQSPVTIADLDGLPEAPQHPPAWP